MKEITSAELKQLINDKKDFQLIDVREEYEFDEIQMEITDPKGDVDPDDPNDENFKVKNVIFTIDVNGERAQLWVFYDLESGELHECEDLGNYDFDTEELAKAIYEIDQRLQASINSDLDE
jgi:rhodanese-related sulfurtransferase